MRYPASEKLEIINVFGEQLGHELGSAGCPARPEVRDPTTEGAIELPRCPPSAPMAQI